MSHLGVVVGFIPWIIYWVVASPSSWRIAAFGALAAAVILMIPSIERHQVKVFDIGTVAFFLVLALLSLFLDRQDARWLEEYSQAISSTALALIAIFSLVIGRPFTLQYAREHVPRELWSNPGFVRSNYVITGVWAAALTGAAICGFIAEAVDTSTAREWLNWIVPIVLIVGAVKFTMWYPDQVRARARTAHPEQTATTS